MRDTVNNVLTYRVRTPDGVNRAVCDALCGQRLLAATAVRIKGAELVEDPKRITGSCAACGWCGKIVAVPVGCRIHSGDEDACPGFDAFVTEHMRRAIVELSRRCGGADFTPRFWQYVGLAAALLGDGGLLEADVLVDRVWDAWVDWA